MFVQKEYSGTKSGFVNSTTSLKVPGLTTNVSSINKFLTDLYGECLADFLKNVCKLNNARYDNETGYTWIDGVPYLFAVTNTTITTSQYSATLYIPFNTSATAIYSIGISEPSTGSGTSPAKGSFYYNTSTGAYSIGFRFIGDPTTAFILLLGSTTSSYRSGTSGTWTKTYRTSNPIFGGVIIWFFKGKDLLRNLDARFISISAMNYNYSVFICDIDDEGNFYNIGRSSSSIYFQCGNVSINAKDIEDAAGKLLLRKPSKDIFEVDGCYLYPYNAGFPNCSGLDSESQVFVTIDGEKYWVALSGSTNNAFGLVKCPTPD